MASQCIKREKISPHRLCILGINLGINRMADFSGRNAFRLGRVTVEKITAHIGHILIGAVRTFAHATLSPRNIRQLITLNQIEKEVGFIV